ncbi:GntR family transcriptional regulator [Enemella evansiae]|uniref:GntR family transcriptional regulator n=1 Tax=Enemella evansiae TaxID=2016499 RepID=UPI000B976611|nr:GntR family transcriptional regulator [Enemella evansiae]OYO02447.1 GntR family transcriptional regulator [Enemella evansiae]
MTIEAKASPTMSVDEIFVQLRNEILHGQLEAGAVISQVKLAERLGVNRTPLREALRMLQREHLVTAELNRRVRIAGLDSTDLVDLYALRITEEALGIRLSVPKFTTADLAELRDLLASMDEYADPETVDVWETYHRRFHRLLISHAGERIAGAAYDLADYCERYRRALLVSRPISFDIGRADHHAITDACADRDADQAVNALSQHLARTALSLLSMTDPAFDPRPVREALTLVTRA